MIACLRYTLRGVNSLRFRLILAFALVVMLGAILLTMISIIVAISEYEGYSLEENLSVEGGPIEYLREFYIEEGSWENVRPVLSGFQSQYPPNEYGSITFSFIDDVGEELFNAHISEEEEAQWTGSHLDESIPVEVDGETVGILRVKALYSDEINVEINPSKIFIDWFRDKWWQTAIAGALIGVVFGVLMARTLIAPLRRLSDAAQAIGSRDLSRRVEVRGSAEVRQLAESFNEMAADLEQAENLRRTLVADVAHELRTPLTVLQGNLRAILDDVYPLSKTEVAALYDQTRMLSHLVNDLHELSQAEARKLPMHMERLNMAQLVEHITAIFIPIAESQAIKLRVEMASNLPVFGDRNRLQQVLTNLIKNAINHTPNGGEITINAHQRDQSIYVTVRDTGSGITREHLPYVFDRFYRADRSRSRDKGGAGLGLAISKAIIEAHDGDISAVSDGVPGKGTQFTISLPVRTAQTPVHHATSEHPALATQPMRSVRQTDA